MFKNLFSKCIAWNLLSNIQRLRTKLRAAYLTVEVIETFSIRVCRPDNSTFLTKRSAVVLPMPDAAPVIIATLDFRRRLLIFFHPQFLLLLKTQYLPNLPFTKPHPSGQLYQLFFRFCWQDYCLWRWDYCKITQNFTRYKLSLPTLVIKYRGLRIIAVYNWE